MKWRETIKHYNHWLVALVLCSIVVVPSGMLFPHTNGKTLFFVMLFAVLAPILMFAQRKLSIPRNHITIALSLFVISMILSTISSVDPLQSLWGTDTRGFGLWVWLWIWILYILLSNIVKEQNKKRFLIWFVIMMGNIAILKVISEVVQFGYGHRAESLFGNPLLYANVAIFPLFFALERFFQETDKRWKVVALLSAIVSGAGIYLTQTRGVIVGLVVAIIAIIAYGFRPKTRKQKKRLAVIAIAVTLIIGGLWAARDTAAIKKIKALNRILHISISESSANQRLILWNSGIQASLEKPIFGWGPETFDYAFNQHFNPLFTRFGFNQTYSDRAHNMYVDALVMQGIVGLLILIYLLLAMLRAVTQEKENEKMTSVIWLGLLVTYAVQAIFSFDSPATTMLFVLFAALLGVNSQKRDAEVKGGIAVIVVVLLSIPTLWASSHAIQRSQTMLMIQQSNIGKPEIELAQTVLGKWSPHQNSLAQRYANVMFERADRDNPEVARLLQSGIDVMKAGIERSPDRFEYYFTLGNLLTKASYIIDTSFAAEADAVLAHASALAPLRVSVLFQRANLYVLTEEYEKAVAILDEAVRLGPNLSQSHYLQGLILTYTDKKSEGLDALHTAINMKNPFQTANIPELEHIARVAVELERADVLTYAFTRLLLLDPFTEKNWFNVEQIVTVDGYDKPLVVSAIRYLEDQGFNRTDAYEEVRIRAGEFLQRHNLIE